MTEQILKMEKIALKVNIKYSRKQSKSQYRETNNLFKQRGSIVYANSHNVNVHDIWVHYTMHKCSSKLNENSQGS